MGLTSRTGRRRGGTQTLTATQAQDLMEFVETNHPAAVPFFALCLFAGIRPCLRTGEISRLKSGHVRLTEAIIRIDGEVSKIREPRTITIQPNLAAWLRAYPLEKNPIIPANLQHLREKAVEKFDLTHDVIRHTYISTFVAKFRSIGEAALQASNSESIIRKHYLDLKDPTEAELVFGIVPARKTTPVPADEGVEGTAPLPFPTPEKAERKAGRIGRKQQRRLPAGPKAAVVVVAAWRQFRLARAGHLQVDRWLFALDLTGK